MSGITPIIPTSGIIQLARQLFWDGISLKPFDLLHIASAIEIGCDEFITTDVNSIERDGNIIKIQNRGVKVIQVTDSQYLSPEVAQIKLDI